MPRIAGCNDRQSSFLRAFRANPSGPPPADWPSPAILRRWLRKPRFLAALQSLQSTLRLQSDFLLTSAANTSLRAVDVLTTSPELIRQTLALCRLAHLRQRLESTSPNTPPPALSKPQPNPNPNPNPRPEPKSEPEPEPKYIRPEDRLTDEEFKKLAWQRGYARPLDERPDFPPPVPQDTFYYQLLQSPMTLLWYLKLYDEQGNDHRFQPILINCKHLLPNQRPDSKLPRLANAANRSDNGGAPA